MGITGLIPFLEKASSKINVKDLKGSTVAIDTYCWLHKGAIGCADKLVRGEITDVHIKFCLKYVNLLLSNNIKPILVFDGQHLPAKALTENRRREIRKNAKKKAAELFRLGRIDEARSYVRRSIDITHEMALQLIQECRKMNVDCIVAPYEADAQIAYLNKCNIVQYVITEDSDLTLFGCNKVIFKFDLAGNGLLIESDKYHLAMGCRPDKFTVDKFRYMCILSGCDYLDSLPGIGLAKACKFILMTEETDMKRALFKIPSYLNMRHLQVTDEYIDGFLKADATFKHMFVYDPLKRKTVRLNELEIFNTAIEYCSNAGHCLDDKTAFQLALGNIDPFTFKQLDNWNPDEYYSQVKKNFRYLKSIWLKDFKPYTYTKQKSNDIRCALEFKKVNYTLNVDSSVGEVTNKRQIENEILSLYTSPNESSKKRRRSSSSSGDDEDSLIKINSENQQHSPIKNTHNPFIKSTPPSSHKNLENSVNNLSLLKNLSPANRKPEQIVIVKSRLFSSNVALVKRDTKAQENDEINKNSIGNLENMEIIEEIEKLREKQISTALYLSTSPEIDRNNRTSSTEINEHFLTPSPLKESKLSETTITTATTELENSFSNNESKNKNVEWESISKFKKKKVKTLSIGLSKPTKVQQQKLEKGQSRLSMFGFQKKSSLTHK